jgi:hypothetical protein
MPYFSQLAPTPTTSPELPSEPGLSVEAAESIFQVFRQAEHEDFERSLEAVRRRREFSLIQRAKA